MDGSDRRATSRPDEVARADRRPVVLIVEDDVASRLLARAAVESVDLEALEAGSGEEALALWDEHRPDVVVLDVMMPGMDGFETCARLRERPGGRNVPILIITGLNDVASIERAYGAGATDFVTKPVSWPSFAQHVRYLVRAGCALEALDGARRAAESADRAKTAFLATMSHEIRTPLTAILGFVELLIEGKPPARERGEWLRVVRRNGEHLLAILNRVLDISRLESGQMTLEQTELSPGRLTQEVAATLRPQATDKGLDLDVDFGRALPEVVVGDATRLRQVLINLIENAIKFTERGRVGVRVESEPGVRPSEGRLRFEIRDTGIGIRQTKLTALFEPFVQLNSALTRRYGGAGLGLAVCKRLVELMGGEITVASRAGAGTRFNFTVTVGLPERVTTCEAGSPPTSSEDEAHTPLPRVLGRILLAEDGVDNRRLLKHVLGRAGLDVEVAEDGRVAVEKALAALDGGEPHDLILMDLQMPNLDGLGATRELRRAGFRGPIVALTAHVLASDREQCLAAGFDDFARKPIDRRPLLETIRRHIEQGEKAE